MNPSLETLEAQAAVAAQADEQASVDMRAVNARLDALAAMVQQLAVAVGQQGREAAPPAAAATSAGHTPAAPRRLLDPPSDADADGDELDPLEVPAPRDDLAGATNSNVARMYPDIEAAARGMAANGSGLRTAAVPPGGASVLRHLSDLPSAPTLDSATRGRAGGQGALMVSVGLRNELTFSHGPGSLGSSRKQLTDRQLLEAIPNPFVFRDALIFRRRYLVQDGYLHGAELQAYDQVFEPQLLSLAKQFVGNYSLLGGEVYMQCWQRFLVFERDVIYEIYEQRLSFADLALHLTGPLLHKALSMCAAAAAGGGLSAGKPRASSAGGGAGASGGGTAVGPGYAKPLSVYLATEVPQAYRDACCVPFWRTGSCSRPTCTHAATGHKCLRCGAADHGGGQCPRA